MNSVAMFFIFLFFGKITKKTSDTNDYYFFFRIFADNNNKLRTSS